MRTLQDGLSAYSVFNPGTVRLHGTLTAEDLQGQMTGMMPSTRGHADVSTAMDRQEDAREAAALEAALQASLEEF